MKLSDDEGERVEMFAEQCRRYRIGFINMEKSFRDYTRREEQFPRGFPNSIPSEGHFNRGGHELIAEAIFHYIQNQRANNAIHPD